MKKSLMTGTCLVMANIVGWSGDLTTIGPDDPKIAYAGFVHREFVSMPDSPEGKVARFDRVIDMPGTGYRFDNPGARIRFRTDARTIVASLHYNERHQSKSARNSVGVYSVDDVFKPEWSFRTRETAVQRDPETVQVALAVDGDGGFHEYEIFLPYGDSVDFAGLKVKPDARLEPIEAEPRIRYVAYGDSVTQGFTAGGIDKTYPFLVAKEKGWEAINLGLGGRSSGSSPADAQTITSLKADVISLFIGVNDWQGSVPPERYRANLEAFVSNIRKTQPKTPVYLLTSLWVAPNWSKPSGQVNDLETYRQVLRDLVEARNDPNLHLVEGVDLIDPDPLLFDKVAVHPNDEGFAMMAERLAEKLNEPPGKSE